MLHCLPSGKFSLVAMNRNRATRALQTGRGMILVCLSLSLLSLILQTGKTSANTAVSINNIRQYNSLGLAKQFFKRSHNV